MPDELSEFTLDSWHGLVDYGTVYADDDRSEEHTSELQSRI